MAFYTSNYLLILLRLFFPPVDPPRFRRPPDGAFFGAGGFLFGGGLTRLPVLGAPFMGITHLQI
jgi:hypothetical protein